MLDDNRVVCFAYRHIGVHDIFLSADSIFFCDTFGDPKILPHAGNLMASSGAVDSEYFMKNPRLVRGIAGNSSDEMLVGGSFSGARSDRFKGHGSIMLLNGGKVSGEVKLTHSAQVYQIISDQGLFVEGAPPDITPEIIHARLEATLGKAVFEGEVPPLNFWTKKSGRTPNPFFPSIEGLDTQRSGYCIHHICHRQ